MCIHLHSQDLVTGKMYVTDADYTGWWSGVNARGQAGMFPSNYVEVIDSDSAAAPLPPPAPPAPPAPSAPNPPPGAAAANRAVEEEEEGEYMVAQYEYV